MIGNVEQARVIKDGDETVTMCEYHVLRQCSLRKGVDLGQHVDEEVQINGELRLLHLSYQLVLILIV